MFTYNLFKTQDPLRESFLIYHEAPKAPEAPAGQSESADTIPSDPDQAVAKVQEAGKQKIASAKEGSMTLLEQSYQDMSPEERVDAIKKAGKWKEFVAAWKNKTITKNTQEPQWMAENIGTQLAGITEIQMDSAEITGKVNQSKEDQKIAMSAGLSRGGYS